MNRCIVALSLGVVLCSASADCFQAEATPAPGKATEKKADKDTFCVTIWPRKTRVQIDEHFDVLLRVVNATEKPQSFQHFHPDWDAGWKTDNDPGSVSEGTNHDAGHRRSAHRRPRQRH